jgi:hypothetical protein
MPAMSAPRKLAAILAADVAGYSRLTGARTPPNGVTSKNFSHMALCMSDGPMNSPAASVLAGADHP